MGRSFYLYRNKKGRFTAEILDPKTGARLAARDTGAVNRDQAVMIAVGWVQNGLPQRKQGRNPRTLAAAAGLANIIKGIKETADLDQDGAAAIAEALRVRGLLDFPIVKAGPGNVDFIAYLKQFWDYDKSPYVKDRLAHKHRIGRRYTYEAGKRVDRYWAERFPNRKLHSITRQELKKFSLDLAGKGFSAGYLNMILNAGIIPLAYAGREGLIAQNPAADFERFSHDGPGRGVLTPGEAKEIFAMPWPDRRAYVGNILAMTSGLRHGEILALTKADIDQELPILHIRHSWSGKDGLKAPKNGEARKVPVMPEIKEMLLELLEENPHGGDNPFIFYGVNPNRPSAEGDFLRWGLKSAMEAAGIDYKARKISFHSHRHFYCARLADRMTAEEVSRISGHKSKIMFEHYADHVIDENVIAMGKAGAEVFENILPQPDIQPGKIINFPKREA
jgi:integrase